MKQKLNPFFKIILLILIITSIGCKKDKLEVTEVKEYSEVNHVPGNAYDGGWRITLQPDGTAEIVPSGDISYRGTYKINGSKIKVKTIQDSGSYTFEIISETEIKEKKYGTLLRLK